MIYSILKKNNYKHPFVKKFIHNQSYILLQQELKEKIILIKELKEQMKELKCNNNNLNIELNKLKDQESIYTIYGNFYKNNILSEKV